jgi:hypothetical protein
LTFEAIAHLFGLLIRRYVDPVVALDIARMFNTLHCKPQPLDDADVVSIATDIAAKDIRSHRPPLRPAAIL